MSIYGNIVRFSQKKREHYLTSANDFLYLRSLIEIGSRIAGSRKVQLLKLKVIHSHSLRFHSIVKKSNDNL